MPQTPKSVSALLTGSSQSNTVYTVPAGTTAVVKSILGSPVDNNSYQIGVLKSSGGVQYPVSLQNNQFTPASGGTVIQNYNIIQSPLTLAAGEKIDMSISNAAQWKFPENNTPLTDQYGNIPNIFDIVYANSIYMAVGQLSGLTAAYCATSSDGITWTQQQAASNYGTITDLVYMSGSTMWVAIAGGSIIYSTNNGSTWTSAATIPTGTGLTPIQLAASSNLIGAYCTSSTATNIWYSTNGATWTASTTFAGANSPGGSTTTTGTGISWSGTAFITSQWSTSQITTDFVNWQFIGCSSNYDNTYASANQCRGITYSSAYARYYMTGGISVANRAIAVSNNTGNANLWQWATTSPANSYNSVQCAGANTVLIANPQSAGTARAKSTDGLNFTAVTDIRGWSGLCLGLANGQYYTFQNTGSSSLYVSTDPITLTGTQLNSQGASFRANAGAADPVSGAWVIIGDNNAGSNLTLSGSTATTGGSGVQTLSLIDPTIEGYFCDICWSSSDSKFYLITDKGRIYSATAANAVAGTWTFVNNGFGTTYTGDQITNIRIVGSNIYVTGNSYTNLMYVATIAASPSFVGYSVPYIYADIPNRKQTTAQNPRGGQFMASDGTNVVIGNTQYRVAAWVPANNRTLPSSFPAGVSRTDTVNGVQFAYGGVPTPSYNSGGVYSSTNLATTYGYSSVLANTGAQNQFPLQQKIAYFSGKYYFIADNSSYVWTSTTNTNFVTGASWTTSSAAGVNSVTPRSVATNGTNGVFFQGSNNQFRVCITPAPSRFAAAVTLSLVEIS